MSDVSDPTNSFHVFATDDGWEVTGDIDVSTAPALAEAFGGELPTSGDGRVVVDVADVTFIDSSGLRVLIELNTRVGTGQVTLRSAPRNVRRLLELTGLSSAIRLEDSASD